MHEPSTDNEKIFLEKLSNPNWTFSSKFSPLAKDFFLKLCNSSPIERYTSEKALKHPWITRQFDAPIPMTQTEEIRKFQTENNLRQAMNITFFLSVAALRNSKTANATTRQ